MELDCLGIPTVNHSVACNFYDWSWNFPFWLSAYVWFFYNFCFLFKYGFSLYIKSTQGKKKRQSKTFWFWALKCMLKRTVFCPTASEEEAETYEGELSLRQSYTTHCPHKNPCYILINYKPLKKISISHMLCKDIWDFSQCSSSKICCQHCLTEVG